jgi:hypothetical protein
MPSKSKQQPAQEVAEPLYPAIEDFVGSASADEVAGLFKSIKDGLADVKGPNKDNTKKIGAAIEQTEELLSYLLQVREKIQASRGGRK